MISGLLPGGPTFPSAGEILICDHLNKNGFVDFAVFFLFFKCILDWQTNFSLAAFYG